MYYPYLRGKQFELIAIRELLEEGKLSKRIIPLIEPVTLSSTLNSTLKLFVESEHRIALIKNPAVGSFLEDFRDSSKKGYIKEYNQIVSDEMINTAYICDTNVDYSNRETQKKLSEKMLILTNPDVIAPIQENGIVGKLYCIPDERTFRRSIKGKRILLTDNFNKQKRNADYLKIWEEFFSSDHLFYKEDGYDGFSDYSVIGESYSESGFAPYAMAIHILYFDKNNELRITHPTSDTNHGPTDPAKKYYEAVTKLNDWYDKQIAESGKGYVDKHIKTTALEEFIEHAKTGNYCGLGVAKKLSLKHHLELLSRFLEGELDHG